MPNRKLQIFVSSTYGDLIPERLAAIEAILAAGHIPAAMEQFTPGDETAWEKIRRWIDESDAFMLILASRYGSVEPVSGKSYVQLEYEYARKKSKPFFSLVVSDTAREARIRAHGSLVLEQAEPLAQKAFEQLVRADHCGFWSDAKDIQSAVFRKLPEWAQRDDLVGWVRADQAASRGVIEELTRLSTENRELRHRTARSETFDGLTASELLAELEITLDQLERETAAHHFGLSAANLRTLRELFMFASLALGAGVTVPPDNTLKQLMMPLVSFGLVDFVDIGGGYSYRLTPSGRMFRNHFISGRD